MALAGFDDALPELMDGVTLPVLLDTTDAAVAEQYGASKWYMYFIDEAGKPVFVHYYLHATDADAAERILLEMAELKGAR